MPVIPSAEERRAIVQALQTHYLITLPRELIEITPKVTSMYALAVALDEAKVWIDERLDTPG